MAVRGMPPAAQPLLPWEFAKDYNGTGFQFIDKLDSILSLRE
jgi:hypothetical protein